jgi:hypothetical protein
MKSGDQGGVKTNRRKKDENKKEKKNARQSEKRSFLKFLPEKIAKKKEEQRHGDKGRQIG